MEGFVGEEADDFVEEMRPLGWEPVTVDKGGDEAGVRTLAAEFWTRWSLSAALLRIPGEGSAAVVQTGGDGAMDEGLDEPRSLIV